MLYSLKNQYPQPLPFRIKLSTGQTRTDPSTFTEEELQDVGYVLAPEKPSLTEHQWLTWEGSEWVVHTKTQEQIDQEHLQLIDNQWYIVKQQRDEILRNFDWRYIRYQREVRLGRTPKDRIEDLDLYTQQLADITNQEDPFSIVWPAFAGDAN